MAKGDDGDSGSQVTRIDPWPKQQPYLEQLYSGAQGLYNQNLMQPYPTSGVGPRSGATQAGEQYALGYSSLLGPEVAESQRTAWQQQLAAPDVNANPALQGYVQAALRPIEQAHTERTLPNLQSAAIQSGAYGGAQDALLRQQANRDYQNTIADTTSRIYSDAYNRGMTSQANAIGMAPTVMNTGLMPGTVMSQVGAQQDTYNQRLVDDARRMWQERYTLPWQQLSQYGSLISGNPGSVSTAPGPVSNDVLSGLGGAMTGATLANAMGMSSPWGWALAGLGALGGVYG